MQPVLTHVALQVRDLPACAAFYCDYCGLEITHERDGALWLAEPGRETEFVIVLLAGGQARDPARADLGHLGFACASREEVDAAAAKARAAGCLIWEPREEPYPVAYFCGLTDPDGNFVEFSYGQPLGPGAAAGGAKDARKPNYQGAIDRGGQRPGATTPQNYPHVFEANESAERTKRDLGPNPVHAPIGRY